MEITVTRSVSVDGRKVITVVTGEAAIEALGEAVLKLQDDVDTLGSEKLNLLGTLAETERQVKRISDGSDQQMRVISDQQKEIEQLKQQGVFDREAISELNRLITTLTRAPAVPVAPCVSADRSVLDRRWEWFVWVDDSRCTVEITGTREPRSDGSQGWKHPARGSLWGASGMGSGLVVEDDIQQGQWLSIPPKEDVFDYDHVGECRVPVKGELFLNYEGCVNKLDNEDEVDMFRWGGRRWIMKEKQR